MDEIKIWTLDGERAVPVQPAVGIDSEERLEEILVKNPEMLIPGLTLVGRQTATDGGPLDLLGVDSDGRLVLFELKRGRLSRDAVAQIIDYASYLETMDVDELAKHIADQSGAGGIEKIENFHEWHAGKFGEDRLDVLLPLRMFLVGLGVDDRTQRMAKFLNGKGMSISLLTFQGFTQDDKTLLARQMPVETKEEPVSRPSRNSLSSAEMQEELLRRAKENDASDLLESVRAMFRENWIGSRETPGAMGFSIGLPGRTLAGGSTRHAYGRIDPGGNDGRVVTVFYPRSVELCREQFAPLLDEIPHTIWPPGRQDNPLGDHVAEIQFPVNADEWVTHKDKLSALTRAVYDAYQALQSAEASERLFSMARASGSNEVIKPALDMFRENWRNPNESYHRLGLELKHASGSDTARAYARIGPEETAGSMEMVFYRSSVELCRDQFAPLLNEIRYQTWPRDRKDNPLEDPQPEIQFLVNADEWETHKDKLSALTRAVYEAYQARYS